MKTVKLLAAVLAVLAANSHAVQFEAGRPAGISQIGAIKTASTPEVLGKGFEGLPSASMPGLAVPGSLEVVPTGMIPGTELVGPEAILPHGAPGLIPTAPEIGRLQVGREGEAGLGQGERLAASFSGPQGGPGWSQGARIYDGGKEFAPVDGSGYYGPSYNESAKITAARGWASQKSQAFSALNSEFDRKGGYFLMSTNLAGGALASSGWDRSQRPVIVLSHDLLNRFNGKWQDEYRGAPWEFIASVIAREQVFSSDWYASIPASAEKLAASVMNLVKVFVDLTNGTTRSWATDKDFRQTANDAKSYVAWGWFEQLVIAARDAAANVGRNAGHFIDSKFMAWARDWTAPKEASNPAFQYTLWELYDGKFYRPNDPRNGQPIPSNVPRIDKATYDREAYKVYGADGKANNQANQLDAQTIFGWIISWLKGRSEI
ncbi:MAG: hypothetical protein HY077_04995 [Elusimicrobia bacterium]|nr:hypothetical protein [Elusimicrobiota bacterium]